MTYLSSRAFPSTILSPTPSLTPTISSHPILLPAVDSFNHARGHPVSWMVDPLHSDISLSGPSLASPHDAYQISMITHKSTAAHIEVFNNYGPKPNSELILGYGFSFPANPDDTIVLKVAGGANISDKAWEVGRDARGSEGLWEALTALFAQRVYEGADEPTESERELEAAETLLGMVERKLMALPSVVDAKGVREDVLQMIRNYVEGQFNHPGFISTDLTGYQQASKTLCNHCLHSQIQNEKVHSPWRRRLVLSSYLTKRMQAKYELFLTHNVVGCLPGERVSTERQVGLR
jgi:hypothetical protein